MSVLYTAKIPNHLAINTFSLLLDSVGNKEDESLNYFIALLPGLEESYNFVERDVPPTIIVQLITTREPKFVI